MAYRNTKNQEALRDAMADCVTQEEQEFQNAINKIVGAVEVDHEYTTKQKLNIYSQLTLLSNCNEKERPKYVKKVIKLL